LRWWTVGRAGDVLKVYWLILAETPFLALLFPAYLLAKLFRGRSALAGYVAALYMGFLYFYLVRLNYLSNFLLRTIRWREDEV
jgi:hypothetical protein